MAKKVPVTILVGYLGAKFIIVSKRTNIKLAINNITINKYVSILTPIFLYLTIIFFG